MHAPDDNSLKTRRPALDPLRQAPPPGQWVLWHGDHATDVIALAQERGQPARQPPGLPPLPAGITPPAGLTEAWLVEAGDRRFYVRPSRNGDYVSVYVCALPL